MAEEELAADNATGEVPEAFYDPHAPDPIEASEGDIEPPWEEYLEVPEPSFNPARGIDKA